MIKYDIDALFSSAAGESIYIRALNLLNECGAEALIHRGVLVGFSGGADSVMLLCLLKKLASSERLLAVHVNHMIRGEEAERDELFSRDFCKALGVEFLSVRRDVPSEAAKASKGLEEMAREIRYSIFEDLLQSRNDISCITTAHNATDNLETVIFNMMRGAGTRGVSGIAPMRGNVVRPLLTVPKREIVSALTAAKIPFVTDSTNLKTDYSRNYIRHEIIPRLSRLAENPEAQATRLSANLRRDDEYVREAALEFLREHNGATVDASALAALHAAPLSRVIAIMARRGGADNVERVHLDKIIELLKCGTLDFSVSLPGRVSFIARRGACFVSHNIKKEEIKFQASLSIGENYIPEIDACILLSYSPINEISSNVYKISIQQAVDFDIIEGELYVREKQDGDSYVFGKMTRKLKKLFNDKGIPQSERARLPILCDGGGILWVPGFPVRDGGARKPQNKLYIAVAYKHTA